ncbi:MAG: type I DNA topoisomerase [Succinivibrionaceae bacterium]
MNKLKQKICPYCGNKLKEVHTKKGLMLGCERFPLCKYIIPSFDNYTVKIEKEIDGSCCPLCGSIMAIKSSRYGLFIGCTNFPECQYIYHEEKEFIACPNCANGNLDKRKTKGNKVFWGCSNYPNCTFNISYRPINQKCKKCGYSLLVLKKGQKGKYLQCVHCKSKEFIEKNF